MKRGSIALRNLVMYDGEQVMFHYKDKRTNTKETMTMPVEAFIRALIRHIPDKNVKTIRRYGIYSRRLKSMMSTILEGYQKQVKQLLVNAKKMLKPKNWSERILEEFGINPMGCTECDESYECLGMSVRKNGQLPIQYAKDEEARRYMRKENQRIEKEEIPRDVVEFLDGIDVDHDPFNPPQFMCKKCGEEMHPEYYKNEFGYEFQISDVYP